MMAAGSGSTKAHNCRSHQREADLASDQSHRCAILGMSLVCQKRSQRKSAQASHAPRGTKHKWSERAMLNLQDSLFIATLLLFFSFVAGFTCMHTHTHTHTHIHTHHTCPLTIHAHLQTCFVHCQCNTEPHGQEGCCATAEH